MSSPSYRFDDPYYNPYLSFNPQNTPPMETTPHPFNIPYTAVFIGEELVEKGLKEPTTRWKWSEGEKETILNLFFEIFFNKQRRPTPVVFIKEINKMKPYPLKVRLNTDLRQKISSLFQKFQKNNNIPSPKYQSITDLKGWLKEYPQALNNCPKELKKNIEEEILQEETLQFFIGN